jgi:hypothetical protein
MAISNPITATRKYFSDKIDSFYINALCPVNNRLAWCMRDMMKATPNRKTWNRFFVDSDFDLLRHAGEDIGILSDKRDAVMLFNNNYVESLNITYPDKFLDLSNQVLQVAYMAAYYYPASKNESVMMDNSIGLIQSKKGTLHHVYEFQRSTYYKNSAFDHCTQILKRKGHDDIFICRFEVGSIYENEKVSVFVGYDNENLYYNYHPSESGSVFTVTPMKTDELMTKFKVVTRDDLFKNLTVDLIGFMTGVKPATIPTQRDKLLLDMIEI